MFPVDVAGHGQDGNSTRRPAGGVEGAAPRRRLDHDDGVGQSRDDAVALQELPGLRLVIGRVRREDGATGRQHALRQTQVSRWEEARVSAPEHAHGRRRRLQRPLVGRSVDTQGEARDDAAAGAAELGGEPLGQPPAVWRGRPRADDRHAGACEGLEVAAAP